MDYRGTGSCRSAAGRADPQNVRSLCSGHTATPLRSLRRSARQGIRDCAAVGDRSVVPVAAPVVKSAPPVRRTQQRSRESPCGAARSDSGRSLRAAPVCQDRPKEFRSFGRSARSSGLGCGGAVVKGSRPPSGASRRSCRPGVCSGRGTPVPWQPCSDRARGPCPPNALPLGHRCFLLWRWSAAHIGHGSEYVGAFGSYRRPEVA